MATTRENGTRENLTMYDGYGIAYNLVQTLYNPYRFGGKHGYYLDTESGMQLLGHRYYLPVLGRFLTQDPLGHDAGLNLYQYANNNPLTNVDPDGMDFDAVDAGIRSGLTSIGMILGAISGGVGGGAAGTLALPGGGTVTAGAVGTMKGAVVGAVAGRLAAEGVIALRHYFFSSGRSNSTVADAPSGGATSTGGGSTRQLPFKDAGLRSRVGQVLDDIKAGVHRYAQDGTTFANKEGKLPKQAAGYYSEYTVPTPGAAARGQQRVVTGKGGEAYYTADHYKSFVRIPR